VEVQLHAYLILKLHAGPLPASCLGTQKQEAGGGTTSVLPTTVPFPALNGNPTTISRVPIPWTSHYID
jgi:hypothetical protein